MADNWFPDPSNQNQVKVTATKVSSQGGQDVGAQNITLHRLNGTVAEPAYNNTEGTILTSATRSAPVISPTQTNYNASGVIVTLNVTAASGTGGLKLKILGKDPVSGAGFQLQAPLPSTAITATGVYAFEVHPGSSAAAVGSSAGVVIARTAASLPRTWYIGVDHADGSSYTYSVGYSLIQ